MSGLMTSYDIKERKRKDAIADAFISQVNPYNLVPATGLDLRALSRYASEQGVHIVDMDKSEVEEYRIK